MSFLKKVFQKSHEEFTLQDLATFFNSEQEESSIMEFKSGEVSLEKIYAEVTAFLNTEGGLLIIGAPREIKVKTPKGIKSVCQGKLTYSQFKNKDWLIQKLAQNITPAPHRIKIFQELTEHGNIFIIDIPQSTTPPHQYSAEGKYYIRLEEQAKAAPHGIVQALFQKRQLPNLDAHLRVKRQTQFKDSVEVSFRNLSNIPAQKLNYIIEAFNIYETESQVEFLFNEDDVLGKKFSYSGSSDGILVQVVSHSIPFEIFHEEQEYLILASFWCKDLDYDFKFWTYNPVLQEIVTVDRFQYEKVNLLDELERINTKFK